jgi:hypothetical protein
MKRKPIVGEILIAYQPKGRWREEIVEEATVLTVGRKFFTISSRPRSRFSVTSWRPCDYNESINNPISLYESRLEMDCHMVTTKQTKELSENLRYHSDWNKLTGEQIAAIHKIVFP